MPRYGGCRAGNVATYIRIDGCRKVQVHDGEGVGQVVSHQCCHHEYVCVDLRGQHERGIVPLYDGELSPFTRLWSFPRASDQVKRIPKISPEVELSKALVQVGSSSAALMLGQSR